MICAALLYCSTVLVYRAREVEFLRILIVQGCDIFCGFDCERSIPFVLVEIRAHHPVLTPNSSHFYSTFTTPRLCIIEMAAASMVGSAAVIATPAALAVKDLKASCDGVRVSCASRRSLAVRASAEETSSRRDVVKMAGAMLALGLFAGVGNAKAGLTEDLLAKSAANKELNDKKRLATSGANIARAYTVENGTCLFPKNFTGCQDLAKIQQVKFLSEDIKLECEGKEAYKCASDVFWKGK